MNLADPSVLKAFLSSHGLRASKGLGQHFLCSETVVRSVVSALSECKGLLEIGPGPGVLTSPLSETAEKIVALELDDTMIAALQDSAPKAAVRKADALEADLNAILQELPQPRGIVSNLPYYITGPLLTRIASVREHISVAVLMMQKEVAGRVRSHEGSRERGSLSVFLQTQFDISMVAQVPAGAFMPPPKVDSAVLKFVPKSTGLEREQEEAFFGFVRFSFAQPRKTLANNLMKALGRDREVVQSALVSMGLGEQIRAQELSLDQWKALYTKLNSNPPDS